MVVRPSQYGVMMNQENVPALRERGLRSDLPDGRARWSARLGRREPGRLSLFIASANLPDASCDPLTGAIKIARNLRSKLCGTRLWQIILVRSAGHNTLDA